MLRQRGYNRSIEYLVSNMITNTLQFRRNYLESIAVIMGLKIFNIFQYNNSRSSCANNLQYSPEYITPIIREASLFSCNTKRLARESTGKDIMGWNLFNCYVIDISMSQLGVKITVVD